MVLTPLVFHWSIGTNGTSIGANGTIGSNGIAFIRLVFQW